MVNTNAVNNLNVNYNTVNSTSVEELQVSSFTSEQTMKYAIKTPLGQYFNFGNFGAFQSGECNVGDRLRYGNILIDHDIEDLSEKEIETGSNPILDGGLIQSTRFSQKEISINIKIITDTKANFEKEIRSIKKNFNLKNLKLLKKEHDRLSEVDVVCEKIDIEKYNPKGTEVQLDFISLDPNFKNPGGNTKAYRDISGDLNATLIIADTDKEPFLTTLLDLKQVTGTITSIELELNGYKVSIATNISAPEKVIFDGKKPEISVGNTKLTEFSGQFLPFPINEAKPVKCKFIGGTVQKYSIYFIYDNIYL